MTQRNICAVLLVAIVVLAGRSAVADDRRVAVVPFQGDAGPRAQSEVHDALSGRFAVIAPGKVAQGVSQVGGLRGSSRLAYVALSRKVRADAVVSGSLARDTKWRLRIAVRDGGTGALVGSTVWSGRLLDDVSRTISRAAKYWMVAQLAKTGSSGNTGNTGSSESFAAAPAPSPAPRGRSARADADEETDDRRQAPTADADPRPRPAPTRRSAEAADDEISAEVPVLTRSTTRTPMFELAVGPRVFSRSFTYTDNLAGLPGYTIVGAPGVQADLEMYPLARVDIGIRNVGLAGSYETSRNARTQAPGGATPFETKISAYRAGLRYSIPLSRLLLILGADYGEHRFALVGGPEQSPNVGYKFVRPSASFRADVVSAMAVGLTVGYSHVTAVEGLGDANRFRRLTAVGVDAHAMVGYFFSTGFELKLVGDVRYYAHSMHVQPGDPYPVGGAIDAHVGGSLMLGYLLR